MQGSKVLEGTTLIFPFQFGGTGGAMEEAHSAPYADSLIDHRLLILHRDDFHGTSFGTLTASDARIFIGGPEVVGSHNVVAGNQAFLDGHDVPATA